MFGVMLFQWMLAIYILGICDNMIVMYPSLGGRKAVLILSTIRGIHYASLRRILVKVSNHVLLKQSLNMRLTPKIYVLLVSTGHLIAYEEPSFCQMFKLNLLTEFSDVLLDELPCVLPPIWDIQQQIDLYSDASHHNNMKNCIVKLFVEGYIQRHTSLYSYLFFLFLRKIGLGECALTARPSTKLLFGVAFLFRNWMTCLDNLSGASISSKDWLEEWLSRDEH